MIRNGRKTIGVFISQVTTEFQETLSKGISTRAKELNYNVIFFTNYGGYGQDKYDAGEIQIADIPCYDELDGIILVPDTYAIKGLEERIRNEIKEHSSCPVVSVRRKIDEYYNVLIDDDTVIEDIIRHFIVEHGFTRLNFLAGPKGFPDSEKRLASYKRILAEYHIPLEEERIFYGDFWKNKPKEAVDYWLSSSLPLPQAIICANDYMAIATCNALHRKGIKVPDQIAISGCDDLTDASEYSPSITTARMPVFDMGVEAVNKIFRLNEGAKESQNSFMKTIAVYRESCGCKYDVSEENKERKRYYINRFDDLQRAVGQNGYMSGDLTGITKLDEINRRLRFYVYENEGFTDFYLCLFPDWQEFDEDSQKPTNADREELLLEVGIKNQVDYSRIRFSRRDLFPKDFIDDEPLIYFVAILHHQEVAFGYVAIRFNEIKTYMLTFQAWMINVGNALENVRIHSELNRLVFKLEDMYIRDDLTGLYNRRALEMLGKKYLKQAKEEEAMLMVFTADLDKLKMINDMYGHMSGDIAIKAVADALQNAADDDEICMRCGGDEFIVIGLDYNEKKMNHFVQKFVEALDQFNRNGTYEFGVHVSYGWSLITPDDNTTVEDCIIIADSQMYQQKYEKNLRTNLIDRK